MITVESRERPSETLSLLAWAICTSGISETWERVLGTSVAPFEIEEGAAEELPL